MIIKDTFSCGSIIVKFVPHELCSRSIQRPTNRTDCTVKVMWAELRKSWKCATRRQNCGCCPIIHNDSVKMTSWDCQEGNRACTPRFSSNYIHTISSQIHPKNSNFTVLRPRLRQPRNMESYTNISMDAHYCVQQHLHNSNDAKYLKSKWKYNAKNFDMSTHV